jgi:lysophospholipase L1-like esterase
MRADRLAAVLLLLTSILFGQSQTPPDSPEALRARIESMEKRLSDWPNLSRYAQSNAALPAPARNERRVVFMGDSITDGWKLAEYFPGKPYVNRGISGQTTPQMLIRFRPDVVDLKPKVVVILAGTNDIAGNTGPMTLEQIEDNLASMSEIARANGIRVVFSSVMPVFASESRPQFFKQRPPEKIVELNRWIQGYCERTGCVYLDYFSAMVDSEGLLKRELSQDGLHPNDAGYKLMAPMAESAIAKALVRKK